jgi:hypothetical protein
LSDTKNKMKSKNKNQFRQGDVLIERVDELPPGRSAKENGRAILAHGEVTGHAHEIEDAATATMVKPESAFRVDGDLSDSKPMTRLGMGLRKKTAVKHQEHGRIALPAGKYRVTRQREYTPESIRNVAD